MLNSTQPRIQYLFWVLFLSVITGGRWLTQIWLGSLPIADLTFQILILSSLLAYLTIGTWRSNLNTNFPWLTTSSLIIAFWTTWKVFFALQSGNFEFEFIFRDSMFFITLSTLPLLLRVLSQSSLHDYELHQRSRQLMFWSCLAVLIGLTSQLLTKSEGWGFHVPIFSLKSNVFSVRSDQLACAFSSFIIFMFSNLLIKRAKIFNSLILIGSITIFLFIFSSRAVLISVIVSILIGLTFIFTKHSSSFKPWPLILFAFSPVLVLFLMKLPGVTRLLSGLGLMNSSNQIDITSLGAISTQNARQEAWTLVANYWIANKPWGGFYPGQHVVFESGAIKFLSGDLDVRWPHNFLLSIMFRNGVIVGSIIVLLIACILLRAFQNAISQDSQLFDFQILGIVISLIIVSSVGVVMESPFGYIPFTIAAALVLTRNSQLNIGR